MRLISYINLKLEPRALSAHRCQTSRPAGADTVTPLWEECTQGGGVYPGVYHGVYTQCVLPAYTQGVLPAYTPGCTGLYAKGVPGCMPRVYRAVCTGLYVPWWVSLMYPGWVSLMYPGCLYCRFMTVICSKQAKTRRWATRSGA